MKNAEVNQVITTLNRLTIEGAINWNPMQLHKVPGLVGYQKVNGQVFSSEYKNKKLVLYKYDDRSYYDEDAWHPEIGYRLMVVNNENELAWEFPENRMTPDLYDSILYKVANIDNFFNQILEK